MKKTIILSLLLAALLDAITYIHSPSHFNSVADLAPAGNNVALAAAKPVTKAAAKPTASPAVSPTPVPAAPAIDPAVAVAARLSATGLSPTYASLYLAVQAGTGTPWQIVAAVHSVETHQSGSTSRRSSAGAIGPFQFMPATWRAYALDGDANGTTDITDIEDSAVTAGRYLAAGGAAKGNYTHALYNYNHSNAYVNKVLSIAHRLGL